MSKVPNKLTTGLRKVKDNQADAPSSSKQTPSAASPSRASRDDTPARQADRVERDAGQHPTRVWPD